ncbi:hypothetical protein ACVWWO_005219 [Bradyrhizobium sp. F1.13.1]
MQSPYGASGEKKVRRHIVELDTRGDPLREAYPAERRIDGSQQVAAGAAVLVFDTVEKATALARRSAIRHNGTIMKADAAKHFLAISESKPRHVGILAYPGVALLDAVGPLEVFAAANIVLARRSPPCAKAYHVEIWSERVGAIDGSCGVSLNATRSIAAADPFELDTLIVAGSPGVGTLISSPCVDWLREATGGIRRVGGICTRRCFPAGRSRPAGWLPRRDPLGLLR